MERWYVTFLMVRGLVTLLVLILVAIRLRPSLLPLRSLANKYPADSMAPPNTRMFGAVVGYFGSSFTFAGSSRDGLYVNDTLLSPGAALIPWSVLGKGQRIGPLTLFWLSDYVAPLITSSRLVRARDMAPQQPQG